MNSNYLAGEVFTAGDISVTYALGAGQKHCGAILDNAELEYRKHTPRAAAKLGQAARSTLSARQFHGSNSLIRLMGWSAMRASTSASHAWGSTSLRRQVWISENATAAR